MTQPADNTTPLEVPQTMSLDTAPAPEPIKSEKEEIPVYKDEVREAIFAKRRGLLEQEMLDQGLEPQGKEPPPETTLTPVPPEPKVDETPVEKTEVKPELKAQVTPEQEEFLLNVYGQTKKLSKDELIREAQKGMAAAQIFQEGYRMREEAQSIANSLKQNLQPKEVAKENPPQTPLIDKDKAREIAKRINYGSEDDQISALQDLGASIEAKVRGQVQTLPPEQLVNYATQQAIAAIEARTEQDTLKREFADILSDAPIASAADVIANQLDQKYRSEGVIKSRLEIFREAGTMARDRYMKPKEQPPENPAPPVMVVNNTDKLERKRAAPKPPAAANKVSIEPPPAYGVGVSAIVNQMRKARGQPVIT